MTEKTTVPPEVFRAYQDGLAERRGNPDKIMWDASELAIIDADLVTLTPDTHPRLWSQRQKWSNIVLIGLFYFLAPFASTIFAPSIQLVMKDLHVTDPIDGALQIAVFLIAFAVGPLFLAPLSEIHGRKIVLLGGNFIFVVFGIGGGFAQTSAQLIVCRFLSGLGGSSSMAVFGGALADSFDLKDRAKATGLLYFAVILGPVAGPACGGWMSERASWRWTCWVPAIAATVLHVVAVFCLREPYIPVLLKQKLKKCRAAHPERRYYTVLDMQSNVNMEKRLAFILIQSIRPVIYLCVDPALFLLALTFALIFGILYLVIVTFSDVFGTVYGHSPGIIGIDLLSEGIGSLIGMIISVKIFDVIYARATATEGEYKPETRLASAFGGVIVTAAGLFMYGFSAGPAQFMVPLVGVALFSAGSMNVGLSIQLYVVDCFEFPASAVAAVSTIRCIFGGVFPLFGQKLFDALGINWGNALLGFLTLGIGGPAIPLLYIYGKALRRIGANNFKRITNG